MTVLAKDRITPYRAGVDNVHPVAAATKIYAGALVMLNGAGDAVPASAAASLTAAGVAQEQADNSAGAAGDKTVKVQRGTFRFVNGEAITKAAIGELAFADDDQTVYTTATGRSPVGLIVDVDGDGVWVEIPPRLTPAAADADLTDSTGGAADGTVADVSTAVTGVDGTGSNAASKADVDARLGTINDNFAELATDLNALKATLRRLAAIAS